jgi:ATP-dependent HslUV protease subunit HslV
MHAVYDRPGIGAGEIARIGVDAGVEFDKSSAGPIDVHTVRLQAQPAPAPVPDGSNGENGADGGAATNNDGAA